MRTLAALTVVASMAGLPLASCSSSSAGSSGGTDASCDCGSDATPAADGHPEGASEGGGTDAGDAVAPTDGGTDGATSFAPTCGAMIRASVDSTGQQANGASGGVAVSNDGRFVVFASAATNLFPNDNNGKSDVFVRDLARGTTELVSVSTSGTPGNAESGDLSSGVGPMSARVAISADGRFVAFTSQATNLAAGATSGGLYLRDRTAHTTELVSLGVDGGPVPPPVVNPSIGGGGRFVSFESSGLFVRDRSGASTTLVQALNQDAGVWYVGSSSLSQDGQFPVYGQASYVTIDFFDVYAYAVAGARPESSAPRSTGAAQTAARASRRRRPTRAASPSSPMPRTSPTMEGCPTAHSTRSSSIRATRRRPSSRRSRVRRTSRSAGMARSSASRSWATSTPSTWPRAS